MGESHQSSRQSEEPGSVEELKKALEYYKKQTDKLSAENIKNDAQLSKAQNELKQRKAAFRLMVELQAIVGSENSQHSFIRGILEKVSGSMKLDYCALFSMEDSKIQLIEGAGTQEGDQGVIQLSEEHFGKLEEPLLVNKNTETSSLIESLRKAYGVKFYITIPVKPEQKKPLLLVAGRQKEIPPFYPALNEVDIHTLQAIGSFIRANVDLYELHQKNLKQQKEKQELIRRKKEELEELVEKRTRELSDRNEKLEQANEEIETQRDSLIETNQKLEATLEKLRSTQQKLIQKEKMASLGQLTAGVAHEIKNPLNFVNNFSELSSELVEEVLEEFEKVRSKIEQDEYEYVLEVMQDLEANIKRINEHGQRADSIVKGMLQHSRGEGGEPEAVDLNRLLTEYVDLAYHGMRANNSSFNADIEKNLSDQLPEIQAVPQDISRAILNIINNGLQAAWEYSKSKEGPDSVKLYVSTSEVRNGVCVIIRDNGPGIPEEHRDKIFEPFYTTKPTGEGTGLGLSIVYDIINAHNGDVEVNTQPGEYTEFKVFLPYY